MLAWNVIPPQILLALSFPSARAVPVRGQSVLALPTFQQPRALLVQGRFSCTGGGMEDLGTTNLLIINRPPWVLVGPVLLTLPGPLMSAPPVLGGSLALYAPW